MKVVFIGSLAHSGSTLLDLMLNAHPEVTSVGELKQLGRFAHPAGDKFNKSCTCGAPRLWDCVFWERVNAFIHDATGQTLADLNVDNYGDVKTFRADNALLFKAIAATAGTPVVVDSSKNWRRLSLLIDNPDMDVLPIFLLRDPKGQVCSSLRKKNGGLAALIKDYVVTNVRLHAVIANRRHAIVRYEQLVGQPEATLSSLMQAMGLSFDSLQLDWSIHRRHNVGGNRMRRRDHSVLKLDERWRQSLTLAQRLAIDIGTLPGRFPIVKFGSRIVRASWR